MADIVVRVGQQNAIKVVASNNSVANGTLDNMSKIGDVNTNARTTNTFLMYNGSEYIHVPASEILDLADSTDDSSIDYGSF